MNLYHSNLLNNNLNLNPALSANPEAPYYPGFGDHKARTIKHAYLLVEEKVYYNLSFLAVSSVFAVN